MDQELSRARWSYQAPDKLVSTLMGPNKLLMDRMERDWTNGPSHPLPSLAITPNKLLMDRMERDGTNGA